MRDYGIVSPRFWIGDTGKSLRGNAPAQVLALYLMTSPHANMIGVFHCPILYMAHETGLGIEGASKALACLIEADFCTYEEGSETVFVHRMAAFQVGESLSVGDKRVKGIEKEWTNIDSPSMRSKFHAIYSVAFHLPAIQKKRRATEGPSKPLRSQEQEQEQDQEQDQKGSAEPQSDSPPPALLIPLVDKTEYPVAQSQIDEWQSAYPAVDVMQQLRQMRTWCFANPANQKTRRGVDAFIVRWLSKVQDKGGKTAGSFRPVEQTEFV